MDVSMNSKSSLKVAFGSLKYQKAGMFGENPDGTVI